jgi:hypothetical protein
LERFAVALLYACAKGLVEQLWQRISIVFFAAEQWATEAELFVKRQLRER